MHVAATNMNRGKLIRILAFLFLIYQTTQTELVLGENKWNNFPVQNYTTSNNDVIIGQIGYFDRLVYSVVSKHIN